MKLRKGITTAFVAGGVVGALFTGALATPPASGAGRIPRYPAVIRCPEFPQEDDAANVELASYLPRNGNIVAIYRCTHHGY